MESLDLGSFMKKIHSGTAQMRLLIVVNATDTEAGRGARSAVGMRLKSDS